MTHRRDLPRSFFGSTIKCTLDCDARTFSYSVDNGAPAVAFEGLPAGRVLYPAVFVTLGCGNFRMLERYNAPHVGFVVRTRTMCQAGRCRAVARSSSVLAWLCERAPLWVVVHVCALLRLESTSRTRSSTAT